MYITITAQKLGKTYAQSAAEFVEYLEKENQGLEQDDLPAGQAGMEHFFNQYGDEISAENVIEEIDVNTAKLKKVEPKFYSITVNPSKYELRKLQNSSEDSKRYTRAIMKDYASSFNREINGKPITVDDIKYFAKNKKFRDTYIYTCFLTCLPIFEETSDLVQFFSNIPYRYFS